MLNEEKVHSHARHTHEESFMPQLCSEEECIKDICAATRELNNRHDTNYQWDFIYQRRDFLTFLLLRSKTKTIDK